MSCQICFHDESLVAFIARERIIALVNLHMPP
jgi:hypothetical protein